MPVIKAPALTEIQKRAPRLADNKIALGAIFARARLPVMASATRTVPRGTEGLRFTPGPAPNPGDDARPRQALVEIWERVEMRRAA